MDYGRDVQFGLFLTPDATNAEETVRLAEVCDAAGLDWIGIQDHPYQRRFFDTWTLLSYLAARTSRVRLFPDVADLPLRPPAMLAKAAASLDVLTGGRIDLGLGTGAFWDGIKALGGPVRSPGEAVSALEEAIQIIRMMWSGERGLRFEGKHYSLLGAHSGPVPAHPIRLIIGAYGPRMLNLTGRLGDGWVPSSSYAPPEKLLAMNRRVDEGAREAGRDPASIQRMYNIMGQITEGEKGDYLTGPMERWVDELTRLTLEFGMDTFIFGAAHSHDRQIEILAKEVSPRVRENVVRERAG